MEAVNGKVYPLWSQFVEKKNQFIGGMLEDKGDDVDRGLYQLINHHAMINATTIIKDIILRPNGADSAFFEIIGEDYSCGFDVRHGGIIPGKDGWVTFNGFGGHIFAIKTFDPPFKVGQYVHFSDGHSIENGRVKSLHDTRKDAVFVVYKCGEQWDLFMNYTAALTEIKYLKPGWKEATDKKMN